MKKQDALFQLINSLTRGEKRNFRMLAQLTSGDKKYLQLFDVIDLMEEYDESKILKKFRNDPSFEKQFPYNKNYLYNSILNSLTYFRKNEDAERSSLILQVRILLEKNLYSHAKKLLRKAKEKVNELEKLEDLIILLQLEVEILKRTEPVELLAESYRQVDFEEKVAFDKILNLRDYRKLEQQSHLLLATHYIARQSADLAECDRILAHPCLSEETNALSIRGKILFNEIHRRLAKFRGDLPTAIQYAARAVELYEAVPALIEEERYIYMMQVSHLAFHQIMVSGIGSSLPTILKIRDTEVNTAQERMFKFEKYYMFALAFMMDVGQKASEGFLKEFDQQLALLDSEFGIATKLHVAYLRSQYHFVQGEYSESLKWVNQVLNHPRTNTRADVQTCARLLNMMIHYELGNLDVIDYSFKSAYRFIYKMERMNKFERRLLGFFRRVVAAPNEKARVAEFESYRDDLAEIIKDPMEKQATMFIKVEEWVDSRLGGKPMPEILQTQNAFLLGSGMKIAI